MPIQFEGNREDDPELRGTRHLKTLGILNPLAFQGLLDDAIQHAAPPARVDPSVRPWISLGPRNIGGRIAALAQDPLNASTLYAGSGHGGLWKTLDAGDSWVPLDDFRPPAAPNNVRQALPIGAIGVSQSNPLVLYVGSGEPTLAPNGFDYETPGTGLYRSADGGATFNLLDDVDTGIISARRFERILVDPWDENRVWIACPKGLWRREPVAPLLQQDALDSPAAGLPANQNVSDVAIDFGDRKAPAPPIHFKVYVALRNIGIFRATFHRPTRTYVTPAGGTAWTLISGDINEAGFQRIKIALCESRPQFLCAVYGRVADDSASPVWRSSDGGDHWKKTADRPGDDGAQASYDLVLEIHPQRPEIIITGSVELFRTRNAGDSWEKILDWTKYDEGDRAQHADQHALLFDALDPRKVWIGNDGGISLSRDLGTTWRKRSHGILAGMFNDVTVHPTFPFMTGGGLQDNGSWVGFGGPSWFHIMGGDGGTVAFVPGNPQILYSNWQGWQPSASPPHMHGVEQSNLQMIPGAGPVPAGADYLNRLPDLATSPAAIPLLWSNPTPLLTGFAHTQLFAGIVEHHPTVANHILVGRVGAGYVSTNGTTFSPLTTPAFTGTSPEVSAVAYALSSATNQIWWIGTSQGQLFRTTNAGGAWTTIALPGIGADWIGKIAVHPLTDQIVAVAVARNPGMLFLSGDAGTTWEEISGRSSPSPAVPPGPTAPAADQLSPSPITCVAFEPSAAAAPAAPAPGTPITLFVGTLAGIYVVRNVIPPVTPPPGPSPAPVWRTFNQGMPLVLISDLATVRDTVGIPAAPIIRTALRCATFGRGIFECDLAGFPDVQLLIRDTPIDDGQTRPAPLLANDPRQTPAAPLVFDRAFDIRVDAPPFSFFDETMDGVEFDEDLVHDVAVAGERNLVYVQVHQLGARNRVHDAQVHLYFANSPGTPPPLQAGFWDSFPGDPPAGAWQRPAPAQSTRNLGPAQPAVLRFDWTPPANATAQVALLAVATHTLNDNVKAVPLPLTLDPATSPNAVSDRRVALRLITVQAFAPEVFVRDGVDDSGLPGAVAWGARAVDIIPSENPVATPDVTFKDIADQRPGDRLVGGKKNHLYVRVFNRKNVPLSADVELFQVPYATLHQSGTWQAIAPKVTVADIPGKGWKFAPVIEWDNPPDPAPTPGTPYKAHLLVAVISRTGDAPPNLATISSLDTFWRFFLEGSAANNAAIRVLRWRPNS